MADNFKSIKRVLMRVDYNVPINNGVISDLTRIQATIPTINFFLNLGKQVVLMSHLGRPKAESLKYSLKILVKPLSGLLKRDVFFYKDWLTSQINLDDQPDVVLLENLRFYSGEINNDKVFAENLSRHGDIYVNDAFGVSHRYHASTFGILSFFKKKYKGFLLSKEIKELTALKNNTKTPFTVLVGGSKIGSKIHILKTFLGIADNILIGGGMAFPFVKKNGGDIGESLCLDEELDVVTDFLLQADQNNTNIILPVDCVVTDSIKNRSNISIKKIDKIPPNCMGVDIGPQTMQIFEKYILDSKLILWNGPMGIAEIEEFSQGTKKIANLIASATHLGAYSLIGGGDTVSDVARFGLKQQFSYVSTGGGAMLEFFKNNYLEPTKDLLKINNEDY
tara:strand:+ start:348 stop:1526 length:1179 start_codon:yes stop_codon:yes gene_type:complete